ncbi:MAG TPA: hypothetical protein VFO60_05140, partial [Candidatus Dormibacteraeota bacterium]|nr:hypothetical protein [Candidatus Dormibacteraeota bacterium]
MYDADPDLASRLQEARTAYEYREPPAPSAGPSASMWVSYDDVPLAVQFARTVAGIQATIAIIALIIVFFLGLSVASDLG